MISTFAIGTNTGRYVREHSELLPAEGGQQYTRSVRVEVTAGFPPGTPEDETLAKIRGELEEAVCDVVNRQRERRAEWLRKAAQEKAKERKRA